ncbi:MAG: RNA-binding protein [Kofleriaceae bacterium]
MGTKLYVGNLNYNTTEDSLRQAFGADGREVTSVAIIMDRETGRSRGFAFVEMATPEGASQALQALDGQDLDGRMLRINEARERDARGPGGPRPGGGGFGGPRPDGPPGGGYAGGGGGFGGPPPSGVPRPPGGFVRPPGGNFGPPATPGGNRKKSEKERERDRGGGGDDRGKKARRGKPDGGDGW